jgi:putative flavoprotein involved in K+ transport
VGIYLHRQFRIFNFILNFPRGFMKETVFDVIIVGAGFSGLCASYHLKRYGLSHLIFERGKIGESWLSQRWDNFRFNSTNKINVLPGEKEPDHPDRFGTVPEFVSDLRNYAVKHQLPLKENSKVISVEKPGEFFIVKVSSNDGVKDYLSRQVLVASGASNEIKIPSLAKSIAKGIKQFHTSEYKNAEQLPGGAVLVVGGAQSGIQITEDLVNAGRKVFLSTSRVGRIPRWYRGRDIFYWLKDMKFYEESAAIKDPTLLDLRPPHVAGTGNGKESLSLQSLAKKGAIILGKLKNVENVNIFVEPNAADHVKFADDFSKKIKKMIDDYITQNKISAPPPQYDGPDQEDVNAASACPIIELDLKKNNINSIIWATGFDHDQSFIKLPVFDEKGKLIHKHGIPGYPGVYFLGHPLLRSRKSTILFGIIEDVDFVVDHIYNYAKQNFSSKEASLT